MKSGNIPSALTTAQSIILNTVYFDDFQVSPEATVLLHQLMKRVHCAQESIVVCHCVSVAVLLLCAKTSKIREMREN